MTKHAENQARILLVDDDDNFRFLTMGVLTDEGFFVKDAPNGEEAIRAAHERTYDLALLDMKMPGMYGMELLARLRKESPATDCIVITGEKDIELAIDAIKLGAKEFLTKPVNTVELIQRVKSVLRAHDAEARLTNMQSEFTSTVLHDLLTPLESIKSTIEFLGKETGAPLSAQQKNLFQTIETTISKMGALLNDMIDLSLFESGRADIEKIPSNLDELIPGICERLKPRLNSKKIALNFAIGEHVSTVAIDQAKIEQVINNLLENAITYTPEGGRISVRIAATHRPMHGKNSEFVQVSVSDTGPGISKGELLFVFDKYKAFLTGKTSGRKTTGLGLALCRSIVEAHHGTMEAASEPGKGSEFKFLLPVD